jgi:hypothetical protein
MKPPRVPSRVAPQLFCRECLVTIEYNRQYPDSPKLYCSSCGRRVFDENRVSIYGSRGQGMSYKAMRVS